MLLLDPFSQSQVGVKTRHCTEGERARNQECVPFGKGSYILSGQRPDYMSNAGRGEDRVKLCLSDRESEGREMGRWRK